MNLTRVPKRILIEAACLVALAVAVGLPWGCSRNPQNAADSTWNNTYELPNGVRAYPGSIADETQVSAEGPSAGPLLDSNDIVASVEAVIGILGGTLTMVISPNESAFLTVPPMALLANTQISGVVSRSMVGPDLRETQFKFGPEGLQFRLPAMLTVKSVLPNGSKLDLEWWDPARQAWVKSAEAVVVLGHATFPVLHFSDYRTQERISLGGQQNRK